jgi:hypothetical protein
MMRNTYVQIRADPDVPGYTRNQISLAADCIDPDPGHICQYVSFVRRHLPYDAEARSL